MRWFGFLVVAIAQVIPTAVEPANAGDLRLERVVMLTRHGVRSPTLSTEGLADYSPNTWPEWSVDPANLTPRGRDLVKALGAYFRADLAARGLLSPSVCPLGDEISMYTDLDQRTVVSGEGLLEGLYPGCALEPDHLKDADVDPLFHPIQAGVCPFDVETGTKAVLGRIGGDLNAVADAHHAQIAALQEILGCCAPTLCNEEGTGSCTLMDVPSGIQADKNGVKLSGPIAIGSTISEIFLLQHAQGMPSDQVAFGKASTPSEISSLGRLHTLQFNLIDRTPYVATRSASALVDRLLRTLTAGVEASPDAPQGPKLSILVGHDNNIARVAGMIGLEWAIPGYQLNQIPVGSALVFELLRDPDSGERFVQAAYVAQTIDQLREATELDLDHPPARAEIAIPGCISSERPGLACPLAEFQRIVGATIDPECVLRAP